MPAKKKKPDICRIVVKPICDEITTPDLTDKQRRVANVFLSPECIGLASQEQAELANCSIRYVQYMKKNRKFQDILFHLRKKVPEAYVVEMINRCIKEVLDTANKPLLEYLLDYIGEHTTISRNINLNKNEVSKSLSDSELEQLVNGS